MALLRSLLTGISGLRAQQTAIDITGDNIANVNTVGYKASRINFSTLISQTMRFGTAPQGFLGGTNPSQVGLGVQVANIQRLFTQGALRTTGVATDLAIDDGATARTFFIVRDATGRQVYTRNGAFALNRTGNLYDASTGNIVQGWMADTDSQVVGTNGEIDFALTASGPVSNISIEIGNLTIAKETSYTDWRGNLNGGGDVADNASVLESEALFDMSSGLLVGATESTLLTNLSRSSTGDSSGNPIDLGIEIGSVITIEGTVGGSKVVREFIVGDPPPTGGMTLGDMRDWMQGALGINRSSAPGQEMISAQRIHAVTGEAVNGTLDQVGAAGYSTLALGGASYQVLVGDPAVAGVGAGAGPATFDVEIQDANGTVLVAATTVNAGDSTSAITSSDIATALNGLATANNLPSQFSVTGNDTDGYEVTNSEGNIFIFSDDGSGDVTSLFGASLNSAADPTAGTSQQSLLVAGDTITFDNFTPLAAQQIMTAVAPGLGNGANQFEIGETAAETATNLATAINLNPSISSLVTASVIGNTVQLLAKVNGEDGNFTIDITSDISNAGAIFDSTVGIEAEDAVAGDNFDISTDGSAVQSTLRTTTRDLTGLTGPFTIQVSIENLTNSPIDITIDGGGAGFADVQDLGAQIIAAIDADANIIAAGLAGTFSVGPNTEIAGVMEGTLEIINSQNAKTSLSNSTASPGDYTTLFASATTTSSNGIRIMLVPENGQGTPGFTGVEVGDTPAQTVKAIAAAVNSSVYTNPPISVSALGTFLRISDNSSIEDGQGNAISGSSMILNASAGFVTEFGNTLIGAGASADLFIEPDASEFTDGVATATLIDDEMDFTSGGVQIGDFIRFSTGPAAGTIGKITYVGFIEDASSPGTFVANPHAIMFEIENTENFPSSSIPSAYTIHEAAAVDIGVNSNLAPTSPPAGLDPSSDAGVMRVSGHVGDSNRISNIEIKVKTDSMQSILTNFSTINEADGESFRSVATVYDSLGNPRIVNLTFWLDSKSNSGTRWRWQATCQDNNVTPGTDVETVVGSGVLSFDTNGRYLSDSGDAIHIDLDDFGVDEPLVATLNFGKLTGFAADTAPDGSVANPTEVFLFNQDGFKAGTLDDFVIGVDGRITGLFDNGLTRSLGQLAVARFANPEGLNHLGGNYFVEDVNSGQAIVGTAGSAGRGLVRSGFLEESNVELAEQFTDLITAQRAYQANARTISTSNQLLQELVNLI